MSPRASSAGCNEAHSSTSLSWSGCRTPPPGKSITYSIAVPYATSVDLGLACRQMNADLPKKSCVVTVERLINNQRVWSSSGSRTVCCTCSLLHVLLHGCVVSSRQLLGSCISSAWKRPFAQESACADTSSAPCSALLCLFYTRPHAVLKRALASRAAACSRELPMARSQQTTRYLRTGFPSHPRCANHEFWYLE
jgi:hypothetical protein